MPKQLFLPERIIIERMIHQDYSFATIGRHLNRSGSTIAREVHNYRCFVNRLPLPGENDCVKYKNCLVNTACEEGSSHRCLGYRCKRCHKGKHCTDFCPGYISSQCEKLNNPPYVCSNCPTQHKCNRNKAYYSAHKADILHHKTVRDAHKGIRKSPAELREIEAIIAPLIAKGQSLNHICSTHGAQLGISEHTLYNYIDKNVFKVRNIDLPKKLSIENVVPRRLLQELSTYTAKGEHMKISLATQKLIPIYPSSKWTRLKAVVKKEMFSSQ